MRMSVFGIEFDCLDQEMLISEILSRAQSGKASYVVPTNLHHAVQVRRDGGLRDAICDQRALVVPDGHPVVWMARLRGRILPLVHGSDMVIPLCRAAAREQQSIFLFGTTFETLAECARRLSAAVEGIRIAGIYSPPFGFENDAHEQALAANAIEAAAPHIVLVALGVPKQEIWAQKHAEGLNIQAICVGASLDFVAGKQRRAPNAFRSVGCEWLWRMVTEPRRLGLRYLTILGWLPIFVATEVVTIVGSNWKFLLSRNGVQRSTNLS